jgi:endonuclease/exonuclease/phosphatase family metal-dependent hydrolase
MHAGAGDLSRLVSDLAAGRLTPAPAADYVLLLQEAIVNGPSDPATVAAQRRLNVIFDGVRTSASRTSGNALVSTLPLERPQRLTLPRERQPRAALVAMVKVAGVDLFVVNAHFENRVGWWRLLFSDGARRRQADALVAQLPAGPGIAGGDLNTWLGRNEPAWKVMAERFPDTPSDSTGPTFRDRLVLDHLFFDLPDGWIAERQVATSGYGSDHRPVVGVITSSSCP